MSNLMRSTVWAALAALATLAVGEQVARADVASCRAEASSYSQSLLTPTGGGDEAFFSTPPGPPNVLFLLSVSQRMLNFPNPLPNPDGSEGYEGDDGTYAGGCSDSWAPVDMTSATDGMTKFDRDYNSEFDPNKNYFAWSVRVPADSVSGDPNLTTAGDFKGFHGQDINAACSATNWASMLGISASSLSSTLTTLLSGSSSTTGSCSWCLQNKGWFRGPYVNSSKGYAWALSGRLMNKPGYQPKFAIARKALKQIFLSEGRVRLGIVTTSPTNASTDMDWPGWFGGGGSHLKPDCDKALNGSGFNKNRNDLVNYLQGIHYDAPLNNVAETLFSAGGYYSDQTDWTNWFDGSSAVNPAWSNQTWANDPAVTHQAYPATNTTSWSDGDHTWTANQEYPSGGFKHESWCFPCQVSSVIIISDSFPDGDNTVPVTKLDGVVSGSVTLANAVPVSWSAQTALATPAQTINPLNQSSPGGVNYCTQFCGGGTILPDAGSTYPDGGFWVSLSDGGHWPTCIETCDQGNSPQGPQTGNHNFLDDVAYFLAHTDLRSDITGTQSLHIYALQLGGTSADPMLEGTAQAGNGQFFQAQDSDSLALAIKNSITQIISQEFTSSAAAVNSIDSAGSQAVFVPRFRPYTGRAFWPGTLQAFTLYNEAVAKCYSDGGGDLNQNGSCNDAYLIDKQSKPVAADTKGTKDPANPGLYYQLYPDAGFGSLAQPFWDAEARVEANGIANRQVWTVTDSSADGNVTNGDTPVQFTPANWATLVDYLAIKNDIYFCDTFAAKSGISEIGTAAATGDYSYCAQYLIRYVLGYDVLNEEKLTDPRVAATHARAGYTGASGIIGDVFHSSPVKVSLPVSKSLCAYGNQCLPTLFSGPTPITKTAGVDAYDTWRNTAITNRQPEYLVVGANDGQVHVFQANCWVTGDDPNTSQVETAYLSPDTSLCSGSPKAGDEVMAFIPPDLLPQLKQLIGATHTYFVDGTAMVRDIWVDANSDNTKQSGEYHTVAVVGERRGGTHYFALDLTNLASNGADVMHTSGNTSRFLWMYPNFTDPNNLVFGETWNDVLPTPPPIGPIRLKNASGLAYSDIGSGNYQEKWMVMLSGGYDPLNVRGRGIYMLDVWSGSLLKEISKRTGQPSSSPDMVTNNMNYSFAAAPGMVSWGNSVAQLTASDVDYFFTTGFVGDTGGQLWTIRFYDPDPANWVAARAFQEVAGDGATEKHRFPFFSVAAAAKTPNAAWLRVNVGTGDRQNLRDQGLGDCSGSNLRACEQEGCKVQVQSNYHVGADTFSAQYSYDNTTTPTWTTFSVSRSGSNMCDSFSEQVDGLSGGVITAPDTAGVAIDCGGAGSDYTNGHLICPMTGNGVFLTQDTTLPDGGQGGCYEDSTDDPLVPSGFDTSTLSGTDALWRKNRFMSVSLFSNDTNRAPFNTASAAALYDTNRVQDYPAGGTFPTLTQALDDGGGVSEQSVGWVLPFSAYDERSSTTPLIVNGCDYWNTVQGGHYCQVDSDCCAALPDGGAQTCPGATCNTSTNECGGVNPCSGIGNSSKFSYNADLVTGGAGCGLAYQNPDGGVGTRRTACTSNCDLLPPPPPTPVVFIDSSGQVRTTLIGVQGQGVSAVNVSQSDDLVQNLYEVLLPQGTHSCRHDGGGCY